MSRLSKIIAELARERNLPTHFELAWVASGNCNPVVDLLRDEEFRSWMYPRLGILVSLTALSFLGKWMGIAEEAALFAIISASFLFFSVIHYVSFDKHTVQNRKSLNQFRTALKAYIEAAGLTATDLLLESHEVARKRAKDVLVALAGKVASLQEGEKSNAFSVMQEESRLKLKFTKLHGIFVSLGLVPKGSFREYYLGE